MKIQHVQSYNPYCFSKQKTYNPSVNFGGSACDVFEKTEEPKVKTYRRTRENIEKIFNKSDILKNVKEESINTLIYYIAAGDERAKDIAGILDIVNSDILSPYILLKGSQTSQINKDAKEDMDKFYDACENGKNVLEAFIPPFKNEEEAIKNTKTGDIFQLRDKRNIYIKSKNGDAKEIFLTPNKYFNLFCPIERYSFMQGGASNCYLISSLEALYSNPNSRERILECFYEDDKGNLSACFGGFKRDGDKIVKKDKRKFSIQNVNTFYKHLKQYPYSNGSTGIALLEMLFRAEIEHNAELNIGKRIKEYTKMQEEIGNNPFIEKNGFRYQKDEIDLFLKFAEEYYENEDESKLRLISFKDKVPFICSLLSFYDDDIDEEEKTEYDKFHEAVAKRYVDYFKENNLNDYAVFDEIMPYLIANEMYSGISEEDPYIDGGTVPKALNVLGIKHKEYLMEKSGDEVLEILKSKDFTKNRIAVACTRENKAFYDKNIEINGCHAYSVIPNCCGGKYEFIVRNPYNSFFELRLSEDELKEAFAGITIGEI